MNYPYFIYSIAVGTLQRTGVGWIDRLKYDYTQ